MRQNRPTIFLQPIWHKVFVLWCPQTTRKSTFFPHLGQNFRNLYIYTLLIWFCKSKAFLYLWKFCQYVCNG